MALLITAECIACAACLPECPNEAIFENRSDAEAKGSKLAEGEGSQSSHAPDDSIYVISYERCTECVGHFDEPQCAAVCPVDDCCIADPTYPEKVDVLLDKARKLNPGKVIDDSKVWSGVRG
jgi:ferredoxin